MTAILFNPLYPTSWVIAVSIIILCVSGWLEVKRSQKFLTLRLVALLLAILAIDCLILNPAVSVKQTSDIILLTHRYSRPVADSLLRVKSGSQLYKLQGVESLGDAETINNYRDLRAHRGNVFILGEGMPSYMIDYLDTSSLHYFPSLNPGGVSTISLNKTYPANQRGEIYGTVSTRGHQTIRLSGAGGPEDSLSIDGARLQPFSLAFSPKAPGLYVYSLTATDSSGKILFNEPVPLQVKEHKPLSILFLSGYPSAEVRFLKNFLESSHHKLTLHYKISKDIYRTEFINTPKRKLARLNEEMLQKYDVVLTDASVLASLPASEAEALKSAIRNGLGMLTLVNTSAVPNQLKDILDLKFTKIKSDSAQLLVNGKRLKIPAAAFAITSAKKLFSVRNEGSGRMVSGYYHHGLGKSGFQLLTQTFNLALAGDQEEYSELWTPLIQSVARKETVRYDLSFTTPFPYYPDEPIDFKIIAAAEKPTVRLDSLEIQLMEDPLIKNVWLGRIWAAQPGWSSLNIDQDSSQHNFFVANSEEWKSLQVSNQQKSMQKLSSKEGRSAEQLQAKPVPRIIFMLTFFFAVGFLWLAPKL